MKYFTPELFVRLQDCQNQAEFRSVNAEWEHAARQYSAHLQEIHPRLTDGLRRFVTRGSLHDAHILDIGTTERLVTLILQEEVASRLLSLTYALVAAPVIERNAFPSEHQSPERLWLYDELDIDPDMLYNPKLRIQEKVKDLPSSAGDEGWQPIFLHSILLSSGWEISLRFHRFTETRTTSLFRPSATGQRSGESLSRSGQV